MNAFAYKRHFVVMMMVVLAIGFATSIAMADAGVAMLSDAGSPPAPIADPAPNALIEPDTSALVGDVTVSDAEMCCDGCGEETCSSGCGTAIWSKPFGLDLNLGNYLRCRPNLRGAWIRADYLLWWSKGGYVPPLVTTSSYGSEGRGVIGSPYTSVLFGDEVIDFTNRSGVRTSAGFSLGCGRAIEFDYMNLGRGFRGLDLSSDASFAASGSYSVGNPFLGRPLINNETGENTSEEVADDYLRGRIRTSQSEYFQSYGILFRKTFCCRKSCCEDECYDECCDETCGVACGESRLGARCGYLLKMVKPEVWRFDVLCGWRNYRLEEWTRIHEYLVVEVSPPGPPYIPGSTFDVSDAFETENVFNGAEIGISAKRCYGRWSIDLLAKVALGNHTQIAQIRGGTILNDTFESVVYEGGLLALASNSGRYSRNKFAAIPQLGGEISYQLTRHLRTHVGYSIIYWPNVVRSGALIDLNVDLDQIPPIQGPGTRPAFAWNESDYWAQGVNFGVEARY